MAKKKTTKKTTKKTATKKTSKKSTAKKASNSKKLVKDQVVKKTTKKVTAKQAAAVLQPVKVESSIGDSLWEEIRKLPINLFAMPARVEDHVVRVHGVPGALCVRFKSGAALPALETALAELKQVRQVRTSTGDPVNVEYPKYVIEESDMYVIIKPFVPTGERPELKANPATFVVVPSGKPY